MAQFSQHTPRDLCVSSVSVLEIEYGMARQPQARKKFGDLWDGLQADLTGLTFDARDALHTGQIRAYLAVTGTPIGPYDLLLAGTARARALTLVTRNTSELSHVPGLSIKNWYVSKQKE